MKQLAMANGAQHLR